MDGTRATSRQEVERPFVIPRPPMMETLHREHLAYQLWALDMDEAIETLSVISYGL